jgi:branched-chain amino acid transport system ATP-binding protein
VTEPILSIEELRTGYGAVRILESVNLAMETGEIVTLIGGNGAGKSTLLKAISGLLPIEAGTIRFAGQSIAGRAPERIATLGLAHVPEGRRVFADQTTEDNIWLGAYGRLKSEGRAAIAVEVEGFLKRFPQLGERRRSLAGLLSGGEQQMLAIARALISRPRLLMLDEPSHGLAPIIVDSIFQLLMDERKKGTTILLVEQLAYGALAIADRGYVLDHGRTIKTGTGQDLLTDGEIQRVYLGQEQTAP